MAFRNMGFFARLGIMARLLRGTHEGRREVTATRARSFRLRFDHPPTYETDGEWNRAKAADIRVDTVSRALPVLVPGP